MFLGNAAAQVSAGEFMAIRDLLYRVSGINMQAGKEGLVQTRLAKRVKELGLDGYRTYLEHVESDRSGTELAVMIDLLTTNKTSFFRESQHFDLLRQRVLPEFFASGAPVRLWSAGCSSGEEAYTLAMVLQEVAPDVARRDVRILATDISTRMLAAACAGIYAGSTLDGVPPALLRRGFEPVAGEPGRWRIRDEHRALIRFARLNLMDVWPMKGPFQAIFCRNVMIYFDRPTQERLVKRFSQLLAPGGYLFVGHSESLSALDHELTYVAPAAYVK